LEIHLPQPVLGMDESLGKHQIGFILGVNMGDTPMVTDNLNRGNQPPNFQITPGWWQESVPQEIITSTCYASQRYKYPTDFSPLSIHISLHTSMIH
jgi:hypothetical protein